MSITFEVDHPAATTDGVRLVYGNACELLRRMDLPDLPEGTVDARRLEAMAQTVIRRAGEASSVGRFRHGSDVTYEVDGEPTTGADPRVASLLADIDRYSDEGTAPLTVGGVVHPGRPAGFFREVCGRLLVLAREAGRLGAEVRWG